MALDIQEMIAMQQALQKQYAGWWETPDAEHGKNKMLWMLAEMGEAVQVVKRHPVEELLAPGQVRHDLMEELADTLMFFHDILLCYQISPEEFEAVYRAKHARNMTRWQKPAQSCKNESDRKLEEQNDMGQNA